MKPGTFKSGEKHPRWKGGPIKRNCLVCGEEFKCRRGVHNDPKRGKYCSRKCYDKKQGTLRMEKAFGWKGGKSHDVHGYVLVKVSEHPHAKANGYVMEHRRVMEEHLGRYLEPTEVVHHIDFDKTNNCIENLQLFESASAHNKHHSELKI